MSSWYTNECGHKTLKEAYGDGPDTPKAGLCSACRAERIGTKINFVRFGKPVRMSTNHRDGVSESGMSVYELSNGQISFTGWYYDIVSRPAYLGTGTIVGFGSDGEPVVAGYTVKRCKKYDGGKNE